MTTPVRAPAPTPLAFGDLDAAVALHRRMLPHGFFVGLGHGFLRRYYRLFLDSPHAWVRCVHADGVLVGALVGTLDAEAHRREVSRALPALVLAGLCAMVVRPAMLRRFLATRMGRYARSLARRLVPVRTASAHSPGRHAGRLAVLNHVYVDDAVQGDGIGSLLVEAFLGAARAAGAERAELVTLAGDAGAGAFYRRSGWRRTAVRQNADGRLIEVYARRL